jgi:SAM-dependent methyltransferase
MTQWIIIGCILLLFGAVVFRGAPYVPTLRRSVGHGLDMLDLNKDDLLVDLGSGDGVVLKAAAQRGWRALGYEINPLLCFIARLRCLPNRRQVKVRWRDFWLTDLPQDAQAIFVFLAGPHMPHLARKLDTIMKDRREPLQIISYGFAIPGYLPKKMASGMYLYELKPGRARSHDPEWNLPVHKQG